MKNISKFLDEIFEENEVFEIRIVNTRQGTISGYFDNSNDAMKKIEKYNGEVPAVYFTLNPVLSELKARAYNRLKIYTKLTTNDTQIIKRKWIPIDVDPIRPAGISSTNEEKKHAYKKTLEIKKFLSKKNFTDPIFNDSGNGYHLFYRIDLENTEESMNLIKDFLEALSIKFNDNIVKVDTAVFNSARIMKMPFTWTKKGDDIPERPHRISKVLTYPEKIIINDKDIIESILPEKKEEQKKTTATKSKKNRRTWSVEDFCSKNGLEIIQTRPSEEKTIFILAECPFNPEHKDTSIIEEKSGKLNFNCFHDSCKGKHWSDIREKFDPGYKKKKNPFWDKIRAEIYPLLTKQDRFAYIADFFVDSYYIITTKDNDEICFYKNQTGIYETNGDIIIKEILHEINPNWSIHDKKEIIDKIKILTYKDRTIYDKENMVVLENGILDLRTYEIKDFSPEYYLTRKIPVKHDPEAECPKIEKFIQEITLNDQNMIDYLYEIPADCLNNHYNSQKMHMLVGRGANGKGTLIRLIDSFLGEENTSALNIHQIHDNFKTIYLDRKLANLAGDISSKSINFTGTLKQCRGEDPIIADRKNQKALKFFNNAKMIFSCQEIPTSSDDTDGYYRSWVISQFKRQFSDVEKDGKLNKKLGIPSELSGLLNKVIEAHKRLEENNYIFTAEKGDTFEKKREKYMIFSDNVKIFCEKVIEQSKEEWISKEEMYNIYTVFCESIDSVPKDNARFGIKLKKYTSYIDRKAQRIIKGKKKTVYLYVTLNSEWVEKMNDNSNNSNNSNLLLGIYKDKGGQCKNTIPTIDFGNTSIQNIEKTQLKLKRKKNQRMGLLLQGSNDSESNNNLDPIANLKEITFAMNDLDTALEYVLNNFNGDRIVDKSTLFDILQHKFNNQEEFDNYLNEKLLEGVIFEPIEGKLKLSQ